MRPLLLAGVILGVGFPIAVPAYAAPNNPLGSYDFSPSAVEGSARYVALGGSIVAAPDDYSATFINPAGLGGLTGSGIDIGSDANNIENFVVDPSQPKAKAINDPLRFSFFGLRYVADDGWGIGFAVQTPYKVDDLFNGTSKVARKRASPLSGLDTTEIQAQSNIYTVGAAKTFFDKTLSIGVAANYIQVVEKYDFIPVFNTTSPVHLQATEDTLSADVGMIAKPWRWLRVGAAYRMSYNAPFDATRNADTLGTNGKVAAFRDGKAPDRISFGLAWSPNQYWNVFSQGNYTFSISDAVIIGSNLFPNANNTLRVQRSNTVTGGWGLEFIPIDVSDLTFKLWAGGYVEDAGIEGGFIRYHRTAGFGLSPWFLNLNMAIDDTNLYNNFTVGLGVDLLQASSRIAAALGYKLPV